MTDYQERRAQYLRDSHDWAEDGDLPDASADYMTVRVEADAGEFMDALDEVKNNLDPAAEIRKAYHAGRAVERTLVVVFLRREAEYGKQGTSAPDLLRVVAACIENGDHHK